MSFIANPPAGLRNWLGSVAHNLDGRKIVMACSGSFIVEQILSQKTTTAEIWSNDVSLCSSVLGCLYSGQDLPVSVADPFFDFASPFLEQDMLIRAAATIALSGIIVFSEQRNDFQIRMWKDCVKNFPKHVGRVAEKIARIVPRMRLAGYTMQDSLDIYPQDNAVAICFPPIYAEGCKRLSKKLEEALDWPRPTYQPLTKRRREDMVSRAMQMDHIIFDNREHPGSACVALFKKTGNKKMMAFSNLALEKHYAKRKATDTDPGYPILMPDQKITEDSVLSVVPTKFSIFSHYRNLFLSKKITPESEGESMLLTVDGHIFGAAMFLSYSVKLDRKDEIYLMSDFAVPSNVHKRLSKLVLLCLLSSETRRILEKMKTKEYNSVLTSVFTTAAVSMKYRGIFELVKRGDGFLNYRGYFRPKTIQEALQTWWKKYEKR